MSDHDYNAGRRDGKIEALEEITRKQDERLKNHDNRLSVLERIAYALMGIIAFLQFWPLLAKFIH